MYYLEKEKMLKRLDDLKPAKKWRTGVVNAAYMIIDDGIENEFFVFEEFSELREKLLNGASNWRDYSYSGSALIYDYDICKNYCTPSEQKRLRDGARNPNSRENWCDVQARGLGQAYALIKSQIELMQD